MSGGGGRRNGGRGVWGEGVGVREGGRWGEMGGEEGEGGRGGRRGRGGLKETGVGERGVDAQKRVVAISILCNGVMNISVVKKIQSETLKKYTKT